MFRTKSYLEDTPDFLLFLQAIGDGAILATIDVYALYSNIKREDVVEAVRKALETQKEKMVPAFFILDLFDLKALSSSTICLSLTASCICS